MENARNSGLKAQSRLTDEQLIALLAGALYGEERAAVQRSGGEGEKPVQQGLRAGSRRAPRRACPAGTASSRTRRCGRFRGHSEAISWDEVPANGPERNKASLPRDPNHGAFVMH